MSHDGNGIDDDLRPPDKKIPEVVVRMTRDIAKAAATMSAKEARFLVDQYYIMQDQRKRSNNQVRALGEAKEPNSVLVWLAEQDTVLENQLKRAMDEYTKAHPMGKWMRSIYGIGPVLSAGILAHIDISKCPTAGTIWRFAGLDFSVKWESTKETLRILKDPAIFPGHPDVRELIPLAAAYFGRKEATLIRYMTDKETNTVMMTLTELAKAIARQPWNAKLKVLCWKIGQSFLKFSNEEKCYYGHLYKQRKAYEVQRNESGGNVELAKVLILDIENHATEAYKALLKGKLPPGQLDARAQRWAVKIFLSHLHAAWYKVHFKTDPPKPFAIAILGHAHEIPPPTQ